MRIIYDEYGQTGNRFLSYIDSIGWAICNDSRVVILFPEKVLEYYDSFRNSQYISLPLWNRNFLLKIMRKLLLHNIVIQRFYQTSFSKKLGFHSGWELSGSYKYYPKVKDKIKAIFTPNRDITDPINRHFSLIRQNQNVIIGVHIRRGDYKTYMNGKFYYDDIVYLRFINQISSIIPNSMFYISSNEPVPQLIKDNCSVIERIVDSAPGDMYALSQCNYIIGPPSTFSGWASLIGDVPLYYIKSQDAIINIESFVPIRKGI